MTRWTDQHSPVDLGLALRRARLAKNFTQEELAEAIDLAVEAYGRIERGINYPRADTLRRLSAALDVSADELLGLPHGSTDSTTQPGPLASSTRLRPAADAQPLPERARRAFARIARELGARSSDDLDDSVLNTLDRIASTLGLLARKPWLEKAIHLFKDLGPDEIHELDELRTWFHDVSSKIVYLQNEKTGKIDRNASHIRRLIWNNLDLIVHRPATDPSEHVLEDGDPKAAHARPIGSFRPGIKGALIVNRSMNSAPIEPADEARRMRAVISELDLRGAVHTEDVVASPKISRASQPEFSPPTPPHRTRALERAPQPPARPCPSCGTKEFGEVDLSFATIRSLMLASDSEAALDSRPVPLDVQLCAGCGLLRLRVIDKAALLRWRQSETAPSQNGESTQRCRSCESTVFRESRLTSPIVRSRWLKAPEFPAIAPVCLECGEVSRLRVPTTKGLPSCRPAQFGSGLDEWATSSALRKSSCEQGRDHDTRVLVYASRSGLRESRILESFVCARCGEILGFQPRQLPHSGKRGSAARLRPKAEPMRLDFEPDRSPPIAVFGAQEGQNTRTTASHLILRVAQSNAPVVIFSSDAADWRVQLFAKVSNFSEAEVAAGPRTAAEWERFEDAETQLEFLPIIIDPVRVRSIGPLTRHAHQHAQARGGLGLVVVDFDKVGDIPGHSREERLAQSLRSLANATESPVLALTQTVSRSLSGMPLVEFGPTRGGTEFVIISAARGSSEDSSHEVWRTGPAGLERSDVEAFLTAVLGGARPSAERKSGRHSPLEGEKQLPSEVRTAKQAVHPKRRPVDD